MKINKSHKIKVQQRIMSPPPPTPIQSTVVVDSETESKSGVESDPDNEFDYIQNQQGLPSPERNKLYRNGEFFSKNLTTSKIKLDCLTSGRHY